MQAAPNGMQTTVLRVVSKWGNPAKRARSATGILANYTRNPTLNRSHQPHQVEQAAKTAD
jgi:hypothetical protein